MAASDPGSDRPRRARKVPKPWLGDEASSDEGESRERDRSAWKYYYSLSHKKLREIELDACARFDARKGTHRGSRYDDEDLHAACEERRVHFDKPPPVQKASIVQRAHGLVRGPDLLDATARPVPVPARAPGALVTMLAMERGLDPQALSTAGSRILREYKAEDLAVAALQRRAPHEMGKVYMEEDREEAWKDVLPPPRTLQ